MHWENAFLALHFFGVSSRGEHRFATLTTRLVPTLRSAWVGLGREERSAGAQRQLLPLQKAMRQETDWGGLLLTGEAVGCSS